MQAPTPTLSNRKHRADASVRALAFAGCGCISLSTSPAKRIAIIRIIQGR